MSAAIELPAKYKAAVYDKPGTISTQVVELDMPEPGPGQVLINLTHSGVCHSDMGVMQNSWAALPFPTQPGQVGGHEGVGKVVKLGPGVETSSSVKVGDRVGIKWVSGICESCEPCLKGMDACCVAARISGYYTPGTFQQYVCGPANYVTPIPDGLDSAAAAPLLCAGLTVYSALRKSGVESGGWVVISGAGGGLGHLAVQFASRALALRVIGIDHSSKKSIVLESGAEHFFQIDNPEKPLPEAVQALTNGLGAHAVIVLTAANAAYAQAVEMLRFGGRVVCVGVPEGTPVPIATALPQMLVGKALSIVGVAVGDRREAKECLEFAARGIVKPHFRLEKLEKLTSVFEEMDQGKLQGRVVLDLQ